MLNQPKYQLHVLAILCSASLLAMGGCDERATPPTASADNARPKDVRPTTQELLSGPRIKLDLNPYIPALLEAPASWKIQSFNGGEVTMLHGITPAEPVEIQLSRRPVMSADQMAFFVDGARRELIESPDRNKRADLRPLASVGETPTTSPILTSPQSGVAQLFERQSIGRSTIPPVLDNQGKPTTRPSIPMRWTLSLFLPQGNSYAVYELNFIGLTDDQFEQDKAFLQPIVDSLRYSPTAK